MVRHGYDREFVEFRMPIQKVWLEHSAIQWRAYVKTHDQTVAELTGAIDGMDGEQRRSKEGKARLDKLTRGLADARTEFVEKSEHFWLGAGEARRRKAERLAAPAPRRAPTLRGSSAPRRRR
jgi:hypothetical protein